VWGCGEFTAEWEETPRPEFAPYLAYLAVGRHPRDVWSNRPFDYGALPAGAGICVRREIAVRYAQAVASDPRRRRLGRVGAGLGACEDFDLGQTAIQAGFETGIFTRLRLTHLMPRARVQEDYLLRLIEGHACSTVLLHHLYGRAETPRRGLIAAVRRWRLRSSLGPVERRIETARHTGERRAWEAIEQDHR
jgi:hypothetical protein